MSRVASCPQCEHDLLVPDDAEPSALVKCPQCRAFFELQHAASRELPAALVVESHAPPVATDKPSPLSQSPTLDDFLSFTTPKAGVEEFAEHATPVESSEIAETIEMGGVADVLDFSAEEPAADHGSTNLLPPRIAEEPEDLEEFIPPGSESHEEAAQRIDQWFRSAKTLSDLPALGESDLADPTLNEMIEPVAESAAEPAAEPAAEYENETADYAEFNQDVELDTPAASAGDTAAWDDSQHMDRLLADLENQPIDTYEPAVSHERILDAKTIDDSPVAHEEGQEHFHPSTDWTPDESISITSAGSAPDKKRSIVRTLVVSAFGGLIGLGLGYYALLWLGPMLNRGKEIDFLEVAHYLPKAMLPPVFRAEPKAVAPAPNQRPNLADELAKADQVTKNDAEPLVTPSAPAAIADAPESKSPAPAEKQATFNAPPEAPKKPADNDNRYPAPAKNDAPAGAPEMREPAPLEAPPAKSITESAPKPAPVRIANTPTFTAADVATALAAANAAEPGLVTGSLQDGKEVARTKGASYMIIADLAEKTTFADSADAAKADEQSDEFFHKLLSSAHARTEIAQIVPRWMSHPKRPQNGAFLTGSVKHADIVGSMVEYQIELEGGPTVVVLVPDDGKSIGVQPRQVGVVGAIVDKPADSIAGYKGNAPQAVFAKRLIPLE